MSLELRIHPRELAERVDELADDITTTYRGTTPIVLTVLHGGVIFLADLVRRLGLDVAIDHLAISGYGASGRARIEKDLDLEISGRHVLVVEDIVDTGLTLAYLLRTLAVRRPSSLRVCTLLDRRVRRIADIPLDWVGFEVGDEYLVGYGLDIDGRLRGLPGVLAVTDLAAARPDLESAAARALDAARDV